MWNEFESKSFRFKDRDAIIVYPKCEPNGRLLLKTEYLDAFPAFDIAMLERGYHLIHLVQRNRWAPGGEIDIMADFVKYCAKELNASVSCVIEGISCGGLQAAILAENYPELVGVLYLDAPVLNIISMAGYSGAANVLPTFWQEIEDAYGVTPATMVNFRQSPIDNMKPLIDNNIPIIIVYGNADNVVAYAENGRVLENYYKENGGIIKTIGKSMKGHHPHGLDDPQIIIDFVEENYAGNNFGC